MWLKDRIQRWEIEEPGKIPNEIPWEPLGQEELRFHSNYSGKPVEEFKQGLYTIWKNF